MFKIFTAETANELELQLNHWVEKEKPIIEKIYFSAEGMEFSYAVLIYYHPPSREEGEAC